MIILLVALSKFSTSILNLFIAPSSNLSTEIASGFTKNREKLMDVGNEYLQKLAVNRLHKPYSQSELAIAIRSALNERKAQL